VTKHLKVLEAAKLVAVMWRGPAVLSSLKTLLETGHAMPMTMKRWQGPPK
jgi:hypothetical protein